MKTKNETLRRHDDVMSSESHAFSQLISTHLHSVLSCLAHKSRDEEYQNIRNIHAQLQHNMMIDKLLLLIKTAATKDACL